MADQNKTELTLRMTEYAALWLKTIGAKPIESEVPIRRGWVADLAALWRPTPTESINQKIMPKKPRKRAKQSYNYWKRVQDAWFEKYDRISSPITIVHEIKAFRSDFLKERKTKFERLVANMSVLSVGPGVIKPSEYPASWWVIQHTEKGRVGRVVQRAGIFPIADLTRLTIATNIGERCANRQEHRFWRDIQASHRDGQNTRANRQRFGLVIAAVVEIANAEKLSVDVLLASRFSPQVISQISQRSLDQLNALHGIANDSN